MEAFNELLGEDNIFGLENVMDLLNRLISSLKESPSMMLRFYDNSLAFNLVADTVHELIGIDNLNASLKARVRFATTAEEYLNIDISEDLFPTPNVRPLVEETFESIYTTRWQDFVYVYFGDNLMRLKLTYLEDSVMIQTGQVYYQPTAKILDKMVSYFVRITDHINGIKVVKRALDPDMPNNQDAVLTVDRPLKIDPSIDDKLPDRIPSYMTTIPLDMSAMLLKGLIPAISISLECPSRVLAGDRKRQCGGNQILYLRRGAGKSYYPIETNH